MRRGLASGVTVALLLAVANRAGAQLDTTEVDNEFSIRESPDFSLPPPPEPGQRFITVEGHIEGLVQFNSNWPQVPPDAAPWTTLFAEGESRINVNFGQHFSINSLVRLQRGDYPTTSTVFASEVLFVERLFGIVHFKPLHIYAGKIHPRFGIGWYLTPGLYGTDFDTDYELVEKIGGGMRWDIRAFGRHRFTAETFYTDTSFLEGSLFPAGFRPGLLTLDDGGVGNTGAFNNYALALSGTGMPGLPGLSYQVGWSKQSASPKDTNDEYSWSAAAIWNFPLWRKDVTLEPLIEWVSVKGQGGSNRNVDYLTAAATLRLGEAWALGIHTTQRYVSDFVQDEYRTDSLIGFAVAYQFNEFKDLPWLSGFTAIAGYRQAAAFGSVFQTLGFQLKYSFDF